MRKRRLPPLNALRGFEAAGRHLSFTKAAEELFVTQGAISRQVQELETYLGHKIFVRLTRQIQLTDEGTQFYRVVQRVLDDLESACDNLSERNQKKTLTISVLPTIATIWLMPKLHLLADIYPDIEVRVISSIEPADLLLHDADIAIRVGRLPGRRYERLQPRIDIEMLSNWSGVHADELFADRLLPVCLPELLKTSPSEAVELTNYPLIHTSTRRHAWRDWFRAHEVAWSKEPAAGLQFGHFFMALDAAKQGRGIALVPDIVLAQNEGAKGLSVPVMSDVTSAGEYYLLIHESRIDDPQVQKFRTWILAEAIKAREVNAGLYRQSI
jgi:LysR family transcriptional regulator, glycine cleavage system transcriptional activator